MIRILTVTLVLTIFSVKAQNSVNRNNYYSYFKDYDDYKAMKVESLKTSRLDELEIAKILFQEMKAAGFEWIHNYRIIHLDNHKYIVSICYSEKSKFGFVLDGNFDMIPDKKTRDLDRHSKRYNEYEYTEKIVSPEGNTEWIQIDQLPENLYLIRRDIYWYQSTENEEVNKTLVTREIAIEILKKDIRDILKSVKKN